ncbi:MAG: hypothetical protein RL398_1279 [Planctomycetota bacterium]
MNSCLAHSLVMLACVGAIAAQEQATTLAEACRRADAIAVVEVVAATDPSPDWHRLVLRVDERLAGTIPSQISVLEPAGACCGRSLFALAVGDRRLVFLTRAGNGWHPFGGDRGVLPVENELVTHVRALLASDDAAARSRLLARALVDRNPRIARDAALALAASGNLDLGPVEDAAVATALREAVDAGHTTTPSLLDIALRRGTPALLEATFAAYLAAPRDDQAAGLRIGLARHAPEAAAAAAVAQSASDDARTQIRVAELVAALPADAAAAPLRALLTSRSHPRAQLHLVEAMLAAGHREATLAGLVPAPVLRLANQRRAGGTKWRNVGGGSR